MTKEKVDKLSRTFGIISAILFGLYVLDLIFSLTTLFETTFIGILPGAFPILIAFFLLYGYTTYKTLFKKQRLDKWEIGALIIGIIFSGLSLIF